MRTRFTCDPRYQNRATVTADHPWNGTRIETTYFCPGHGAGYVRVDDAACRFPQVCERLSGTGSTLTASPETLLSVIRREYRRSRRAEVARL